MSDQALEVSHENKADNFLQKELEKPGNLTAHQAHSPSHNHSVKKEPNDLQIFDNMLKSLNGELKPVVSNEV